MAKTQTIANDEAQIRARLDEWVRAFRAKDVDAILAGYAPDALVFDAIGKLQFKGVEDYRKHWDECLPYCQEMRFEMHDLEIAAEGGLAFCHYLARCGGTSHDGQEQSGWLRVTVCLRKTNGTWLIVHEHFSSPFDPITDKVLSLEPEHETRVAA
jgi:uncharacterized protein (TIGR02246 family)